MMRATLLHAPEAWQDELTGRERLAERARELVEGVERALEVAPAGARPYLHQAQKYLALAVSSLAIAGLVEPERYEAPAGATTPKPPQDG